jgi:hypothetical protein
VTRGGALLAACALAGACGFAPQDELTGRRIGDGIAPWQDLGAVELCLGSRRIGPPASTIGGFCAPDGTPPPRACTGDDGCGSRERCVCGRCTVQFCTSAGECGQGHVCSFLTNRCDVACSVDDGCAGDRERCLSGVCRRDCAVDGDCQTGEVCGMQGAMRLCIVADCTDDDACRAGEFCDVQREPREVAEPTVLADEGPELTMYLEMSDRTPDDRAIWRAVSDDGVAYRFDPATPVFENGGDARAPSVVRDAGGVRLFFETSVGIAAVDSADGRNFGTPEAVLTGDWHAPAAAVAPDGETLLYVHAGARDGIALSRGGGPASIVYDAGDVVDPVLWRAVERVGSPFVAIETSPLGEPTVRLWFDAFGTESGSAIVFGDRRAVPPNDSIGFASAPGDDPTAFVSWPFNPVFDRVVTFLEHRAERAPAVVRVPGREQYFLYYEGFSADGTERDGLGVAVNPRRVSP